MKVLFSNYFVDFIKNYSTLSCYIIIHSFFILCLYSSFISSTRNIPCLSVLLSLHSVSKLLISMITYYSIPFFGSIDTTLYPPFFHFCRSHLMKKFFEWTSLSIPYLLSIPVSSKKRKEKNLPSDLIQIYNRVFRIHSSFPTSFYFSTLPLVDLVPLFPVVMSLLKKNMLFNTSFYEILYVNACKFLIM